MTKHPDLPERIHHLRRIPLGGLRALVHGSRARRARIATSTLLLTGTFACDGANSAASEARAAQASIDVTIEHLIELSTPLDPTLTSDHFDRQLHAQRACLAELRGGTRELGLRALERFQEVEEQAEPAPILVRVNLLDIAAHCATAETQPLLEMLLLEYGHRIDTRAEATKLLGQVAPARAVELIGPLLERTKRTSTMPADEFLLQAYIEGCKGSGHDPVPILVDVATNIFKEDAARHRAVQELGEHPARYAQQALRSILIESTGNAYLRRKAAQAVRKSFPREEACALFNEISELEADNNFLAFLGDMIAENCE
jgi:hypothetical protein